MRTQILLQPLDAVLVSVKENLLIQKLFHLDNSFCYSIK